MTLLLPGLSLASWSAAKGAYGARASQVKKSRSIVIELVKAKKYFTAIPWMKSYLTHGNKVLDSKIEQMFDVLLVETGTKQFEVLPLKFLKRSKSNSIRYIVAKKLLKKNHTKDALKYVNNINSNHPIYPFALNLKATALSILGKTSSAKSTFKECERASERRLSKPRNGVEKKQLLINKDYCTLGMARTEFAARQYKAADLTFLDIPKSSYIWPEILFEEAWNSYYLGNYNRTLGKLVSYKAPVFNHIFNPEIDVLNALTYLKLCLYGDAKKTSNNFYDKYMNPTRKLRTFLKRKGKDYKYFYRLMADFESMKKSNTKLLETLLRSVSRDGAYIELRTSLIFAAKELATIKSNRNSSFRVAAVKNLKEVIRTQKKIIGSYVRTKLVAKYAQLYKAFEGMSYIKLEVLAQRKAKLYNFTEGGKKRGDVKYIERNEKQYFWNFNGEFWADELGDYVFALKSEC